MDSMLSPDMRAQMPHLNLKTRVLRKHRETTVHPFLKWIRKEVEVVDQLEFISVVVTQMGRSWEIPLSIMQDGKEINADNNS